MKLVTSEELKNAICNNDLNFLKNNIERFNINHRFEDEDNDTLLSYAISDFNSDVYSFFLNNDADINLVNDENENIVHSAIYSGDLNRIKNVVNNNNINARTIEGSTPLLLSLSLENEEISNYLIDIGASINIADYENNLPIHVASFFGLKNIVLKLIGKGANLSEKTDKGNLPLAIAVNEGHTEVAKVLYLQMFK